MKILRKKQLIYAVVVGVVQVVTILVLLISNGLIGHYTKKLYVIEGRSLIFDLQRQDEERMTNSQLTKFYSNLGFIENKIDYCAIVDFCDDLAVVSAWEQKKGVYNSSETHKNKTITPFLKEGRFFDKAENNNPDGNQIFVTTAVGNVGDTISVYDKEDTGGGT